MSGCGSSSDDDDVPPDAGPDATLSNLVVSRGELEPSFDPAVSDYVVRLPLAAETVAVTPTARFPGTVRIEVAGMAVESGQESAALDLDLGANLVEVVVAANDGEERTYSITVSRGAGILQQAYVKASNTDAGDGFSRVAIDGDTLAVGAPAEASGATGVGGDQLDDRLTRVGAVYVFTRTNGVWSQQAYIKASNAATDDSFGQSVALSGDTLAVGAFREGSDADGVDGDQADDSAFGAGAVYVFTRSAGMWSQQAYIKASNSESSDDFGFALALDEDTLAVGAREEDSAATGIDGDQTDNSVVNAGAVYVFTRDGETWSQQGYLKASNPVQTAYFGAAVSLDGDILAVGAEREGASIQSGAAYIFVREGDTWSQQARIGAPNPTRRDFFGTSVAVSGTTLAVGAMFDSSGATGINGDNTDASARNAGAVYVFVQSGETWQQQAYLKASNTGEEDIFGASVGLDGDTLVVGAPGEDGGSTGVGGDASDDGAPASGAAYLFVRSVEGWSQEAYVKPSNTKSGITFGADVSLSGDTIVIGTPTEPSAAKGVGGGDEEQANTSAEGAGAVYVFQ